MKITYLGPDTTYSAIAYNKLSAKFGAPNQNESEHCLAQKNEEVVPLVIGCGGYGAIAMETEAEGRVEGPTNSFIKLLESYETTAGCPMGILGAIRMPINFTLMARKGMAVGSIKTLVAHPKSFGACKNRVRALGGVKIVESDSNGKAAYDVARNPAYAQAAAFGPRIAAEKNGLDVLEEACEDKPAFTTFFLLGPRSHKLPDLVQINRSLLVFRVNHKPGSLVRVLLPFAEVGINLRQIHSIYIGGGQYDFAIEMEHSGEQAKDHLRAMEEAAKHMTRRILFGPFPVV